MKILTYFFIIFLFIGCGKKEPPPSPDIFPPKIVSIHYHINNLIRVTFNETVVEEADSLMINYDDKIEYSKYFFKDNVLYILYNHKEKVKDLSIYGIKDFTLNIGDFKNVKISGKPIEDTIPPNVERIVYSDTLVNVVCSELLSEYSIEILPEYLIYTDSISENKIYAHIIDTINVYPLQVMVDRIADLSGNVNNKRVVRYFINDFDSSFIESLFINTHNPYAEFYLMDYDTIKIMKEISDSSGYVKFRNLMKGKYFIKGENYLEDFVAE